MNEAKTRTLQTVLLVAASIVLFLTIVLTYETYFHNQKNVTIKLESVETKTDDSMRYVYMNYKIKNGSKKALSSLKADIIFSDKSGKELGCINSSFSNSYAFGMALEKGDSKTVTTYIAESNGQSNSDKLFSELYENGLKNVKVKYEITVAQWDDGYIYNYEY